MISKLTFDFFILNFRLVVLNTEKLIKEAFNETAFSGRPQEPIPMLVSGGPYGMKYTLIFLNR